MRIPPPATSRFPNAVPRAGPGRGRAAVAIVELAISMPLIAALVLGTLEIGRMIEVRQILDNAAREGGRQAASGQYTNSQVQALVLQELAQAGIPTARASVTINDLTSPGSDAAGAGYLDQLEVTVSVPCADMSWLQAAYFFPADARVTADVVWCSMMNQSYPTTVVVPSGS